MTDHASEALSVLKCILERWPRDRNEDHTIVDDRLKGFLAAGFSRLDLHDRVQDVARVECVDVEDRRTVGYFDDVDGWPQRAIFELSAADKWMLVSMNSQCTICFGSGQNDGVECAMCDGKEWEQDAAAGMGGCMAGSVRAAARGLSYE